MAIRPYHFCTGDSLARPYDFPLQPTALHKTHYPWGNRGGTGKHGRGGH